MKFELFTTKHKEEYHVNGSALVCKGNDRVVMNG